MVIAMAMVLWECNKLPARKPLSPPAPAPHSPCHHSGCHPVTGTPEEYNKTTEEYNITIIAKRWYRVIS